MLVLFWVGYMQLLRRVPSSGGFYSLHQREAQPAARHGVGGSPPSFAYAVIVGSLLGAFSYFGRTSRSSSSSTSSIAWPVLAFGALALLGILGHFDIRISSNVLGIALIGEILVLTIMNIAVFVQGRRPERDLDGPDQPRERLQRRGARGRHLLRRLVLGRLRDDPELRRGVDEPQAHRSPGAVHLHHRRRPLLRLVSPGRSCSAWGLNGRRPPGGLERRQPVLRRHDEVRRQVGHRRHGMADHDVVVRLRPLLPQHHLALPVRRSAAKACSTRGSGKTHPRWESPYIANATSVAIVGALTLIFIACWYAIPSWQTFAPFELSPVLRAVRLLRHHRHLHGAGEHG